MEILDAAFDAFAAEGFAGTRLDDVAARAGVTKGTIYVYFDSKEELFVAALKQMVSPALDHLRNLMVSPHGSAADILREHMLFVADHILGRPPQARGRSHADRRRPPVFPCCSTAGTPTLWFPPATDSARWSPTASSAVNLLARPPQSFRR